MNQLHENTTLYKSPKRLSFYNIKLVRFSYAQKMAAIVLANGFCAQDIKHKGYTCEFSLMVISKEPILPTSFFMLIYNEQIALSIYTAKGHHQCAYILIDIAKL